MTGRLAIFFTAVMVVSGLILTRPATPQASRTRPPRKLLNAVEPSPEIEAKVAQETGKALSIIQNLDADNLLESGYLVSAVYYREGFLDDYPDEREDGAPARRIIARISRQVTPELKARFVQLLAHRYREAAPGGAAPSVPYYPVDGGEAGRRRMRRSHPNALDIFADDGARVFSVTPGIVVLAEDGWQEDDPFSSSSYSGGNTVIIFDSNTSRFCRYGHLGSVSVSLGDIVASGQVIGTIGRTGANAVRRGHGEHLHFEINVFDGKSTRPLSANQLRALLRAALRTPAKTAE